MAEPLTPAPVPSLPTAADILPKSPDETPLPAGSEEVEASLPDELLELPVMYGLLHGAPSAVFAEKTSTAPEVKLVVKHQKDLAASGFGFYPSNDGKLTVLFNTVYVTPEQLKEADDAGTLTQLAVPLETASQNFAKATGAAPSAASPSAGGRPQPASSAARVTSARIKNLSPGSPTSGPSPGAGRILNNILKTTV